MHALVAVFDQILEGADFSTPSAVCRVSAESASRQPDGAPYSMATNLAHAVHWQRHWLARLRGEPGIATPELYRDFVVPEPAAWPALRREFEAGLREAREACAGPKLRHGCKSDAAAEALLSRIALHGAYHIGQLALLKRLGRRKG